MAPGSRRLRPRRGRDRGDRWRSARSRVSRAVSFATEPTSTRRLSSPRLVHAIFTRFSTGLRSARSLSCPPTTTPYSATWLDDRGSTTVDASVVYCADPASGATQGSLSPQLRGRVARRPLRHHVRSRGGPTHRHRRNGSVVRVGDGKIVVDGLYHPHSVSRIRLTSCSSSSRRRTQSGASRVVLPNRGPSVGATRGGIVASANGRVWVGVSALRKESSSSGYAERHHRRPPRRLPNTRLVELDLGTGTTGRDDRLSALASEIFDLRVLPSAAVDGLLLPSADGGLGRTRSTRSKHHSSSIRASQRAARADLDRTLMRRARALRAAARAGAAPPTADLPTATTPPRGWEC